MLGGRYLGSAPGAGGGGGGAWTYISTVTKSAQAAADIESGIFSDTYSIFEIIADNVFPSSDAQALYCRADVGGGYLAGVGDYAAEAFWAHSTTIACNQSLSLTAMLPHWSTISFGNGSGEKGGFRCLILGARDSGRDTDFMFDGFVSDEGAAGPTKFGSHCRTNGNAGKVQGVRFLFASGNISGDFHIYGLATS